MPSRGNDAALIENICVLLHLFPDFLRLVSEAAEILGRTESDFSITTLGALTCWVQSWAGITPSDPTRGVAQGPTRDGCCSGDPAEENPPSTSAPRRALHLGERIQMFVFALGRRV